MKKIERVYREILVQALEEKNRDLTQKNLSEKCGISIGTVNYALKPLEDMNAIEKKSRKFMVLQPKKILLYWASKRNLTKDIIYKTHCSKNVREIEQEMPQVLFTAYSGYKFKLGEPPASYSEVYVYGRKENVEERFPEQSGTENVFVLSSDQHLDSFKEIPLPQLYVDLWNLNSWYAQEFVRKMEEEIDGILER